MGTRVCVCVWGGRGAKVLQPKGPKRLQAAAMERW